jgi:hypothetical protein
LHFLPTEWLQANIVLYFSDLVVYFNHLGNFKTFWCLGAPLSPSLWSNWYCVQVLVKDPQVILTCSQGLETLSHRLFNSWPGWTLSINSCIPWRFDCCFYFLCLHIYWPKGRLARNSWIHSLISFQNKVEESQQVQVLARYIPSF